MPRQMNVYEPMEIVITPETTYMLIEHIHDFRRIYTDGRDCPEEMEPTFAGYSIGKWEDTDGDGRFDTLVVETRGLKGPRTFDSTGIPMHKDNQTMVKERIYARQDQSRPHAQRDHHHRQRAHAARGRSPRPIAAMPSRRNRIWWRERSVPRTIPHVEIGKENYMISADGQLMPTRKDQPPPSLQYFQRADSARSGRYANARRSGE